MGWEISKPAPGAATVKVGSVLHCQQRHRYNGEWSRVKVVGETRGTWLLEQGYPAINKKTLCSRASKTDYGWRFYTTKEKEDKLYVEDNRARTARRIEVMQLVDAETLRQIVDLLDAKEEV
jgi:hypothetical protein